MQVEQEQNVVEEYYYWTYRSHPHSDEEFLYDGVLYAQSADVAHMQSKDLISDIDAPEVDYDLGVHMIVPITDFMLDALDKDNISEVSIESIEDRGLKMKIRQEYITEDDVLEVAERQERFDRHEMGEDVDGIVDLDD